MVLVDRDAIEVLGDHCTGAHCTGEVDLQDILPVHVINQAGKSHRVAHGHALCRKYRVVQGRRLRWFGSWLSG